MTRMPRGLAAGLAIGLNGAFMLAGLTGELGSRSVTSQLIATPTASHYNALRVVRNVLLVAKGSASTPLPDPQNVYM